MKVLVPKRIPSFAQKGEIAAFWKHRHLIVRSRSRSQELDGFSCMPVQPQRAGKEFLAVSSQDRYNRFGTRTAKTTAAAIRTAHKRPRPALIAQVRMTALPLHFSRDSGRHFRSSIVRMISEVGRKKLPKAPAARYAQSNTAEHDQTVNRNDHQRAARRSPSFPFDNNDQDKNHWQPAQRTAVPSCCSDSDKSDKSARGNPQRRALHEQRTCDLGLVNAGADTLTEE